MEPNMNDSKISVIVPVYKAEAYLRQCVDSILEQTWQNMEIVLVDDGSPDGSPAICDEYAAKHSRVRVIHQPNGGVSAARNAGLDVATGNYIGFVDSDDWLLPDYYEQLISYAVRHNCDLVIGGLREKRESVDDVDVMPERDEVLSKDEFAQRFWEFFSVYLLSSPVVRLWKKTLIRHPFDVRMTCGEDVRFNMQNQKYAEQIGLLRTAGYQNRIPDAKRGAVKYDKKPEYKGSLYSQSVAEYLSAVLPEEEWREKWEAFYCANLCRDSRKTSLTNSVSDAVKELGERLQDEDAATVLKHKAWRSLGWKYRIVGFFLSKKLLAPLVILEKIIG